VIYLQNILVLEGDTGKKNVSPTNLEEKNFIPGYVPAKPEQKVNPNIENNTKDKEPSKQKDNNIKFNKQIVPEENTQTKNKIQNPINDNSIYIQPKGKGSQSIFQVPLNDIDKIPERKKSQEKLQSETETDKDDTSYIQNNYPSQYSQGSFFNQNITLNKYTEEFWSEVPSFNSQQMYFRDDDEEISNLLNILPTLKENENYSEKKNSKR